MGQLFRQAPKSHNLNTEILLCSSFFLSNPMKVYTQANDKMFYSTLRDHRDLLTLAGLHLAPSGGSTTTLASVTSVRILYSILGLQCQYNFYLGFGSEQHNLPELEGTKMTFEARHKVARVEKKAFLHLSQINHP